MTSHSQPKRSDRLVIGIAGRIGSGKTSVGTYLSSAHGFRYVRYSQVLSEWLAAEPGAKAQLQEVGWEVMAGGKQMELNRRLIARILPDVNVAVDGLRHLTDYESLERSFHQSFHLIFLDSSPEDRWERMRGKGRYLTLSDFEAADSHPVEQRIDSLRPMAARVIHNDSSLEDLFKTVDETVESFEKVGHS